MPKSFSFVWTSSKRKVKLSVALRTMTNANKLDPILSQDVVLTFSLTLKRHQSLYKGSPQNNLNLSPRKIQMTKIVKRIKKLRPKISPNISTSKLWTLRAVWFTSWLSLQIFVANVTGSVLLSCLASVQCQTFVSLWTKSVKNQWITIYWQQSFKTVSSVKNLNNLNF